MARQGYDMPAYDSVHDDPTQYGGGHRVEHFDANANDPSQIHNMTPESDQVELGRYRSLGEAAAARQAYQVDFSKAHQDELRGMQARGQQGQALGLMQGAAQGNAPSRAEIMGAQAGGQSLEAAMGASAGARPGGLAAAQAAAMRGQGQMQLGAQNAAMGGRSAEMGAAIGQYGQGAGTMRAGDYASQNMAQQQAEMQGESELAQRKLNQAGQMGYEQMGINAQQYQGDGALRLQGIQNAKDQSLNDARDARNARSVKYTTSAISAMASASDERAKDSIASLYEAPGTERHYDRDVSTLAPATPSGASLSGPAPRYSSFAEANAERKGRTAESPKRHKVSDDELMRMAQEMKDSNEAQHSAQLAAGPAVGHVDKMGRALEDMHPYQYEYKPGIREQEGQQAGETNVGPMAQDMARNPITGSAVSTRPDGLMQIDMKKATKLNLGAVGYLARKQREQDEEIRRLKGEA